MTTREKRDDWRASWNKYNAIYGEDAGDSHGRFTRDLCDQVDNLEADAIRLRLIEQAASAVAEHWHGSDGDCPPPELFSALLDALDARGST